MSEAGVTAAQIRPASTLDMVQGSAGTQWRLTDLVSVLAHVSEVDPAASFVEAEFPGFRLPFAGLEFAWMHRNGALVQPLGPFWQCFRAGTGRSDTLSLSELLRDAARSQHHLWIHVCPGADLKTWLQAVAATDVRLLCPAGERRQAIEIIRASRESGLHAFDLVAADRRRRGYVMIVSPQSALDGTSGGWFDRTTADTPSRERITIQADDLVTDVTWQVERSGGHAWLWTGPEILHRICLGDVPEDIGRVRIVTIGNSGRPDVRANLALQVNGLPVPFRYSGWEHDSGVIEFSLGGTTVRPVVVGIAGFPAAPIVDEMGRTLRVCISNLELQR